MIYQVVISLAVAGYTGMTGIKMFRSGNKPGGIATLTLVLLILASPIIYYYFS